MNTKSKRKKKRLDKKDQPVKEKPDKQVERDENQPNDYGGLPQRDLKKNLGGCG